MLIGFHDNMSRDWEAKRMWSEWRKFHVFALSTLLATRMGRVRCEHTITQARQHGYVYTVELKARIGDH